MSNLSLCKSSDHTNFLISSEDGSEINTLYKYAVVAVNDIGNSSSVNVNLCKSLLYIANCIS